PFADEDIAGRGLLQPGDEAQRRGLPAARRPDQDGKLLVGNLQGELVHRGDGAELLGHTRQLHPRHLKPSSYYSGIMGKNSRSIRLIPLSPIPYSRGYPLASRFLSSSITATGVGSTSRSTARYQLTKSPINTADSSRASFPVPAACTSSSPPARDNARSLVIAARSASRGCSTASRRMMTCSNRASASSRPQPTVSLWFSSGKVFQTANVLAFSLN